MTINRSPLRTLMCVLIFLVFPGPGGGLSQTLPPAGGVSRISFEKQGFLAPGPWLTGQICGEIHVTVLSRMELPLSRSGDLEQRAETLEFPVSDARVTLSIHQSNGSDGPVGATDELTAVTGRDGKIFFRLPLPGPRREMILLVDPEMGQAAECLGIAKELARKGFAVQKDVVEFLKRHFAGICSPANDSEEDADPGGTSALVAMTRFLKAIERGAEGIALAASGYMKRWKPIARLANRISPVFANGLKFPQSPAWRTAVRKDLLSTAIGRFSRVTLIFLNDISRILSATEKIDLWSHRPEGFFFFPVAAEAFLELRDISLGRIDQQEGERIFSARVFEAYKILAERSFNRFMSDLRKGGSARSWEPPVSEYRLQGTKIFERLGKGNIAEPPEIKWPRDPFSSDGVRIWQSIAGSFETAAVQACGDSSALEYNPFLWSLKILGKYEPAGEFETREEEPRRGEKPYQELKTTIIQYSKFGIYRKLEREIIDRLESFKTYLERLSGLIAQGRSEDAIGQMVLFYGISEEFSTVKETLLAFSLADDSLFTENISQSVATTTRSLLYVQAGQLEALGEFILLASPGRDAECLPRVQAAVTALAEGIRRLSLNVVETFAKIHLEEVSFPGLLVISRISGANQICEALSEIELKYRIWNIGLEGINDLSVSLEADSETKIFEPAGILIKTLGVDEEKVVSFKVRPGTAPREGIVVLRCVYGSGLREFPGPIDFLIIPERVPPRIEFVFPEPGRESVETGLSIEDRKVLVVFDDPSGIDDSTLKVVANGAPIPLFTFEFSVAGDSGRSSLAIPLARLPYGEVKLTVEVSDFSGNISQKTCSLIVERPKWPYYAVFFSFLGIFSATLLACYLGGRWKCPACGGDNKWWTLVCGSCKSPRPAFLLKHLALSTLNFLRNGSIFLCDRLCWLAASARGRVRLVFLRKRFEESLFDLGSMALSERDWLERQGSGLIKELLARFLESEGKISVLDERIASLRLKVETGELYGAKGESLWDIALEIQLAGEEIDKHRRYSRRVVLEIGEWVYCVTKGGGSVSQAISHATRLAFHIEGMFYKIGEEPEFHLK